MRFLKKLSLVLPLLFFLFACSTEETPIDESEADLIVYSGHSIELTNFYVKEFQERTQLKVRVITGGGNQIVNLAEENRVKLPADIIIGVGADTLETRNHLLLSYESPHLPNVITSYGSKEKKWLDDSIIPMVIIYNTQTVSPHDIPESWVDLLNPKFKGEIAMADPSISGSAYTQLVTMLSIFGQNEQTWDVIQIFANNLDGNILSSSQDIPRKVSDGEYMLGITMESYAYEYMEQGENIDFIYPKEGTSARSSGISIFKDAHHVENAQMFIDFVLSGETQQLVANHFYRRPARLDILLPHFMHDLNQINIIDYDYNWASEHAVENREKWKQILLESRNIKEDDKR